jgi:hypothetical protein
MNDEKLVSLLRAAARRAETRRSGTRSTPLSLGAGFQERATALILTELSARPPLPVAQSRANFSGVALATFGALGAAAALVLAVHTWGRGTPRDSPAQAGDKTEGRGAGPAGDALRRGPEADAGVACEAGDCATSGSAAP